MSENVPRSAKLAERLTVYLVAAPEQARRDLVSDVERALAGGVTAVQLRAKGLTDRQALTLGARLLQACRERRALFLVNDRLDIALALGADGVHLGVDDLPVEDVRRIAGRGFVIGYSPDTDDQAETAAGRGADYLGIGPIYGTASKPDAGPAIGLEILGLRAAVAGIPVIGIGGIYAGNASRVIEAGAVGVAVVRGILGTDDPETAARRLAKSVRDALTSGDMSR